MNPLDTVLNLAILGPLLVFVAKGRRWAMITFLILWCAQSAFSLSMAEEFNAMGIFWIVIVLFVFWRAISVENARARKA